MDASDLLAARADQIIDAAMAAMAARHFVHYERMGKGAAAGKLRELLDSCERFVTARPARS